MAERPFGIFGRATIPDSIRDFVRAVAWQSARDTSVVWIVGIALGTVVLHATTGWRYGFDRDELMVLEDARHLAWGYAQYPPMVPFFGRIALALFGTSLVGFRLFAALAQAAALVLTGLMAREMGKEVRKQGGQEVRKDGYVDWAPVVAALAGVPFCLGGGALMQYISFDYFCWVLAAYCMVRLLKSDDERWWLGIGGAVGLGLMAKYTMTFFVVGVIAGVLLTSARKYLRSGWLWAGVLASAVTVAPNLWWQWKRDFVSLEFLRFIHARDVRLGLTNWFLPEQLELTMLAFPLVVAGFWFLLFTESGKRYRALAWMYLVPLALFVVMRGRAYYLAPAYPMLYAAGAVWLEDRKSRFEIRNSKIESRKEAELTDTHSPRPPQTDLPLVDISRGTGKQTPKKAGRYVWAGVLNYALWAGLIVDVGVATAVALPVAPVNSAWWNVAIKVDPVFPEEIGWPEFVETVAGVRDRLPVEERSGAAILAGNYGELGALNLYGGRYRLPEAISGENSSWERGYGDDRRTVIVTGYSREFLEQHFASCEVGARVWNRYGVNNEEVVEDATVYVCRGLKESWAEFWWKVRKFG